MKIKKSHIISNILIGVLVILLSLFILNGSQLYTISKDDIIKENIETIKKNEPLTENIELIGQDKMNFSQIYLYKVDDSYSVFTYKKSMFSNRVKLSSYKYRINSLENFKSIADNEIYNNEFNITVKDDKFIINSKPIRNKKLFINILNIIVVLSICFIGTLFFVKRKFRNEDE